MRNGTGAISEDALTHNISSSGVLFASDHEVPLGRTIEYIVTLTSVRGVQVDLRCIGKVVRLENSAAEPQTPAFRVAATLDRYQFIRREA